MNKKGKIFLDGLLTSNPVFVLVLGMCPTLSVSTTVLNSAMLGAATLFVLVFSNLIISALRKIIPDKVRLPAYIVIIATFVTLVEIFFKSEIIAKAMPDLQSTLGPMISLIVVNCIILGRAEAFAGKNDAVSSMLDGLAMGLGFFVAICLVGAIRQLFTDVFMFEIFARPAGGFLVLGCLMAAFNFVSGLIAKRMKNKQHLLQNQPLKEDI